MVQKEYQFYCVINLINYFFLRCHHRGSCVVNRTMADTWIETCWWKVDKQIRIGIQSNVLYVRYTCTKCKSFVLDGKIEFFEQCNINNSGAWYMIHICLTSVTHVKCGVRSTLCWKIANISGSI